MLYWFIKDYAHIEGIKIVGINTYMEHEEIRERIYKNSDIVLLPTMKPFDIKEKYGSPCFTKNQDEFIERYQNGLRSKALMQRINNEPYVAKDGTLQRSGFALSKKPRELLLSGQLHRISNKCCKYLKKEPARIFEKETGLKPILRSQRK